NLIALLTRARGVGIKVASELNPGAIAKEVVATLQATPAEKRDDWFLPTLAEASLGLDDWDVIERNVGEYVTAPSTKAFHVASTLRQFTEIRDLEKRADRGRPLVHSRPARLMD